MPRAVDAGQATPDKAAEVDKVSSDHLPSYFTLKDFAGWPAQFCLLCEAWVDHKHVSSRGHREKVEAARQGRLHQLSDACDQDKEWPLQLLDAKRVPKEEIGRTERQAQLDSSTIASRDAGHVDPRDPLAWCGQLERPPPQLQPERFAERVPWIDASPLPPQAALRPLCSVPPPLPLAFPANFAQAQLQQPPPWLPLRPQPLIQRQQVKDPQPQRRQERELQQQQQQPFPDLPVNHPYQRLSVQHQLCGGGFCSHELPPGLVDDAIPWTSVRDAPCLSRSSGRHTPLQDAHLLRSTACDLPKWDAELREDSCGQDLALPFPLRFPERPSQGMDNDFFGGISTTRTTPAGALPESRRGPRIQGDTYRDTQDVWWSGWDSAPGSDTQVYGRWWSWDSWSERDQHFSGAGWSWRRPEVPSSDLVTSVSPPVSRETGEDSRRVVAGVRRYCKKCSKEDAVGPTDETERWIEDSDTPACGEVQEAERWIEDSDAQACGEVQEAQTNKTSGSVVQNGTDTD